MVSGFGRRERIPRGRTKPRASKGSRAKAHLHGLPESRPAWALVCNLCGWVAAGEAAAMAEAMQIHVLSAHRSGVGTSSAPSCGLPPVPPPQDDPIPGERSDRPRWRCSDLGIVEHADDGRDAARKRIVARARAALGKSPVGRVSFEYREAS